MRRVIYLSKRVAAAYPDLAGRRVDDGVFNSGQVDDHSVVAQAKTAAIVSSASDGNKQFVFPAEFDGIDDIGDIPALDDHAGAFVDHPIVNFACLIVFLDRGKNDLAADPGDQAFDGGSIGSSDWICHNKCV